MPLSRHHIRRRQVFQLSAAVSASVLLVGLATPVAWADDSTAASTVDTLSAIAPVAVQGADGAASSSGTDVASQATASGTSIALPTDPADGISVSAPANPSGSVSVGLPFADAAADGSSPQDGIVVYNNQNGTSTVPVIHDDGSLGVKTVSTDATAPTDFPYPLEVPAGTSLVANNDGSVSIQDDNGTLAGYIAPAWAKDAAGNDVTTSYTVNGTLLTQHVDLSQPGITFPVVADPEMVISTVNSADVQTELSKTDYGYSYTLSVGYTGDSANSIFSDVKSHYGKVFPPLQWQPSAKLTGVGQVLETRLAGLSWKGVFSGHVKVTQMTGSGWTFYAENDHPDGGGTVAFNFVKSGTHLSLTVHSHIPHQVPGGPTYYALTFLLWGNFGSNVGDMENICRGGRCAT